MTQRFCQLGCAPVVVAAFERLGHRFGPDDVEGVIAICIVGLPVAFSVGDGKRLLDSLVGFLFVDAGESLEAGVHQGRNRVVADHAVVFLAGEGPYGQESDGLFMGHHGLGYACHPVRKEEGVEGVGGAEGVPLRKGGVVLSAFNRRCLVVGSAVLSVHVCYVARLQEEVVKRCVERGLLLRGPFYGEGFEVLLPGLCGVTAYFFEVPAGDLGFHVGPCALDAHRGKCDLHAQALAVAEVQDICRGLFRGAHVEGLLAYDGGVELDDEVHMPFHPFRDIFMSLDGVGVGAAYLSFDDAAVPCLFATYEAALEVQEKFPGWAVVGVSVECNMF